MKTTITLTEHKHNFHIEICNHTTTQVCNIISSICFTICNLMSYKNSVRYFDFNEHKEHPFFYLILKKNKYTKFQWEKIIYQFEDLSKKYPTFIEFIIK